MSDAASPDRPLLVCLGEVLVDFVPDREETNLADAERFVKAAGGAPANVAVAAGHLGVATAVLAAVGDDPFGSFLLRTLGDNLVAVDAVASVQQQTALAFVALGPGGERDFMFYRSAAAHDQITVEQVESALLGPGMAAARTLHLGSNSLAAQPASSASERAITLAHERGMSVSFDVNYRAPFWAEEGEAKAAISRALLASDVVKLSLEELELLTGDASFPGAERFAGELLAGRARLVCVTRGAAGAWYFCAAGSGVVAAPEVRSVDTTGAGDAFMAAVLVADLHDPGVWSSAGAARGAVARACNYASLTTTVRGAIPAYGVPEVLAGFTA